MSYKLGTSLHDTAYTSCHVSYTDPDSKETIESTYTPDSTEGTGQVLEINEKVNSTSEAHELAKSGCVKEYTAVYSQFHHAGDDAAGGGRNSSVERVSEVRPQV